MDRRSWLKFGAASACPAWLAGCTTAATDRAGGARAAGPRRAADARDLAWVDRITWGVDSAAVAQWERLGARAMLQEQLQPAGPAALPSEVQARIDALPLTTRPMLAWVAELDQRRREADAMAGDEEKKAAQQAYQQQLTALARDAANRSLFHALYSPQQLREQLVWFWFNHFNVHQYKANLRVLVGDYEERLRTHALGRFGDLLVASATHAAMIRYLDNEQNAVGRGNENYARELLELHTLGVDGGYAQRDVQELARVLSGLGVNFGDRTPTLRPALQPLYVRDGAMEFNPARHDMGAKEVLGVRIDGRGHAAILEQLDRLARHPSTARHLCRKLAVYFVADRPPPALVGRMVDAWTRSDGRIAVTLQAMFDAPEFPASLGHRFKDPVHYVVSAVRLAYDGRTVINPTPMQGWLNRLGEGLYNRQTPDGYPLDEAAWSATGQMATRFEIARQIGSGSAGLFRAPGAAADVPAFPQLAGALYHHALAATLGDATRAALDGAGSPQAWNALLLSSPEFMRR